MHPFDELKAYVGFGPVDEERLRSLRDHVMPSARTITNRFYDVILRFPDAAAVFEDMAQVERLKQSLARWIDRLLTGPWDEAYYEQRLRIGRVHVRVGLAQQYMFTSMNRLMEDIHAIAAASFPDEQRGYGETLRRVTDIELAIMLGTYIETREQKGLEDLRDILVRHLPTTVLLVDKEGKVATSTTPWNELFTGGDLTGKAVVDALQPDIVKRAELAEHLARAVQTEREIIVPRIDVKLPSGPRMLRVGIIPLRHPLADALIHIEDLTEALAAETRAKHAEHLAKLGTMAASVAHEIRNPLAGISGTVQVVASSLPEGDPRRTALGKVQEQIGRLGTLVGDLLNFSRPITAQVRSVELGLVAANAVAQAQASDGATARIEGNGKALADGALLAQVLLNLVQNAWQAGAKNVVVRLADGRADVVDDGPGVPEDARAKIFEPFFTTKVRGTGLGLPVAKKIVEAMRGTLDLGTSPLGGAAFEVRLPTS